MIRLGMVLATLLLATLPARAQSPVYQGVTIGGTGGPQIIAGAGVPTATAPAGSLYLRKDGSGAVWARIGGAWARISPAARAVGVAALAANSSAVLATIVPGAASYLRTWRVNVAVSRQDSTVTALTRSEWFVTAGRTNGAISTFVTQVSAEVRQVAVSSAPGVLAVTGMTLTASNSGSTALGATDATVALTLADVTGGTFAGTLLATITIEELPGGDATGNLTLQ